MVNEFEMLQKLDLAMKDVHLLLGEYMAEFPEHDFPLTCISDLLKMRAAVKGRVAQVNNAPTGENYLTLAHWVKNSNSRSAQQIRNYVDSNLKIDAIKELRCVSSCSLKVGKDAVEHYMANR